MAKRRSSFRRRRVARRNANRRLPTTVSLPRSIISSSFLIDTEDRRTFHPESFARPARSYFQSFHRLDVPQQPKPQFWNQSVPSTVAFTSPDRVLVCVRRQRRKEVLHAFKKSGKRGQKAPRRSYFSEIHC